MIPNYAPAQRYRETAIKTANPVQLVVMLYDAAICSLQEARRYMEQNDIPGRSRSINRSLSLITEMQSSLNHSGGGEIASSLDRLYDYMKRTIFRANVEQNARLLAEVEALLENLVTAWRSILTQPGENDLKEGRNRHDANGHIPVSGSSAPMPCTSFNISI